MTAMPIYGEKHFLLLIRTELSWHESPKIQCQCYILTVTKCHLSNTKSQASVFRTIGLQFFFFFFFFCFFFLSWHESPKIQCQCYILTVTKCHLSNTKSQASVFRTIGLQFFFVFFFFVVYIASEGYVFNNAI